MLFIFDWDGTLCDSLDKIVHATQAAAADVGLPPPTAASVQNIIGLSLPRAINQVFPGISQAQLDALLRLYAKHFLDDTEHSMRFYPGVQQTLDALHQAGHHIAIATGKSRRGLDRLLDAMELQDYFHSSRCADETASKPNPRMLQELLEEFSLTPEQAVMVGDTEYDMEMAQAIAMPRIAVSYGAHHIGRLKAYQPVLCLDDFDQLLAWKALER